MKIRHAPWSRWFRTTWFKGVFAYELQIGPLVVQWFYRHWGEVRQARGQRRLAIWRDPFWRC